MRFAYSCLAGSIPVWIFSRKTISLQRASSMMGVNFSVGSSETRNNVWP